ncbi:MAG: DUF4142 domain-containing protein [Rhodanobacter sp.]
MTQMNAGNARMTSQRTLKLLLAAALLLGVVTAADAATGSSNSTDGSFMQKAAADGIGEVAMGQMALDKSSNAAVKTFAQRIVDDHGKANDQLKTLAADKQVTLASAPSADAQKESKKLAALSGDAFDKAWSKEMLAGHKKAVKLFAAESKEGKDEEVRQFAQTTLPVLQTHLQMATRLVDVPAARDKSMDQAMKSMTGTPASAAPTSTATAAAPATAPAKAAVPPTGKSH